ncbi:NUDIX hydrolase [Lentzea sp. NPDC058450]|uniref:NUDIX hydrolase n=1 Tax=Lentzea sp. NPDC058450 TaxID=3346505 RepID=UPI0036466368
MRREVLEEPGILVRVERLTGVYKNMNLGIVALIFRCDPLGEPIGPTDEASEIRWISMQEIRGSTAPAYATRIAYAFESRSVNARIHDGVSLID